MFFFSLFLQQATDHIKSLQLSEEKLIAEKSSMVKINHQLWGQLNKVKGESTLNRLETLSPANESNND